MFKASVNIEVLTEICNSAEAVVKECRLKLSKDGIELIASDSAHVAIVHARYDRKAFKDFSTDVEEGTEIAFPIKKLKEALALGKSEQIVTLEFSESENRLLITFGDIIRKMSLLDKNAIDQVPVAKLSHPVSLVIKTEDLRNGIRGSASVSDHIVFELTAKGLKLESTSELDSIEMFIPRSRIVKSTDMPIDATYKSMYPLELLSDIVKSIGTADQVVIKIDNDYPLRLDYALAGALGQATVLIAPRTEDTE
jgi:proliferating cell nuclear antigen